MEVTQFTYFQFEYKDYGPLRYTARQLFYMCFGFENKTNAWTNKGDELNKGEDDILQ